MGGYFCARCAVKSGNRPVIRKFNLLCILVSCSVVLSAQDKDFRFANGITPNDYVAGKVWVKLKKEYRELFQDRARTGKIKERLKITGSQPLIPRKATKNGRAANPRQNIDISLYHELFVDPHKSIEQAINEFYASGYFETVEPAYRMRPLAEPNDPLRTQQYYLSLIKAYDAWDITEGSGSVIIAIVDTGGDLDHPDLQNKIYIDPAEPIDGLDNNNDGYVDNNRGWDFSGSDFNVITMPGFQGDNDPSIPTGIGLFSHGTRVAGCAGAEVNNNEGVAGVGNKSKLLFTKHYADNQTDAAFTSDTFKGVIYAATHGARIINCSWGGPFASAIEQDIITYVTLDLGCLVVAAAGNSNSSVPIYPASYDYVVSVAASNNTDTRFAFSSFGKNVDLTAPGENIYSTVYDNVYGIEHGTSFSSPITAGAAALVWAHHPEFTAFQVAEQLRVTADTSFYTQNPAYVNQLGKGRLDVLRALTLQLPSVRAVNPVMLTPAANVPSPGDNVKLTFDLINYLQGSTDLKIKLSTTSPYISITKALISPGAIASQDTVASDAFEFTLAAGTPMNEPIEVLLKFEDGTAYRDFQIVTLSFATYVDINENNITTTLTSIGRIGHLDVASQSGGSGFKFMGKQMLYEMGLIMGTSSADLFNNVVGVGVYDQDFTQDSKIVKITPGERSYSEVFGTFRNAFTSASASLLISYRSLVWRKEAASHYNDFVIIEYKIKNTTASPITGFHFGIYADFDIAPGADKADWNATTNLGHIYSAKDATLPHAGVQLLKGAAQYYAIDNDPFIAGNPFGIYDGFTDAEKFLTLSSGFTKTQAGDPTNGNDVSHVVASGPHDIPAGEEITLAFALHGASSSAALITSSQYADSVYNYTLNAPKPAGVDVEVCHGNDASINATGATKFKWYKDFTGGSPLASGSPLNLPDLIQDTTVYVSNAEHTYESLRVPVHVKVNPNPVAAFTFSGDLLSGEPVSFTDQSTGATAWSWNFGDAATSTAQNPQHAFDLGGNFLVSLQVTSNKGCQHTTTKSIAIITGTERNVPGGAEVYPNPISNGEVSIKIKDQFYGDARVIMVNAQGQTIRVFAITSRTSQSIDVSDLAEGVYVLKIVLPHRTIVRKMIVQ